MNPPMWAPWRMQYILSPKDHSRCVFCDAIAGEGDALREQHVLVVTEHVCIMLNRFPFNAGHLLVMPTRHVGDLQLLTDQEHQELWRLTRVACDCLSKAVNSQGLNVGMNLGPVAGAGIAEHLHVHVVPRWQGDMNFMPVLADVHVMPQHLDDTWKRLMPFFDGIDGKRANLTGAGESMG